MWSKGLVRTGKMLIVDTPKLRMPGFLIFICRWKLYKEIFYNNDIKQDFSLIKNVVVFFFLKSGTGFSGMCC